MAKCQNCIEYLTEPKDKYAGLCQRCYNAGVHLLLDEIATVTAERDKTANLLEEQIARVIELQKQRDEAMVFIELLPVDCEHWLCGIRDSHKCDVCKSIEAFLSRAKKKAE